jgi:dTDP-4-dehydrorhamnose 3,5-epimerase-like enzyme
MRHSVQLFPIKTHTDVRRGNLGVMEDLPFHVRRVFFIYEVPRNVIRGGHAHKLCHQFFIAMCGAVLIRLGDGKEFILDCPDIGLYVPPKHIVRMMFLTDDTTLLVLASHKYDENDYMYSEKI